VISEETIWQGILAGDLLLIAGCSVIPRDYLHRFSQRTNAVIERRKRATWNRFIGFAREHMENTEFNDEIENEVEEILNESYNTRTFENRYSTITTITKYALIALVVSVLLTLTRSLDWAIIFFLIGLTLFGGGVYLYLKQLGDLDRYERELRSENNQDQRNE